MSHPSAFALITRDRALPLTSDKVTARGKFLFAGDRKFFVRGVSYGAFRPNEANQEYFDLAQIRRDFEMMAEAGFNTVRIPHTMPPVHLLDIAQEYGLRVMVGLSAEQYAGYLIDRDKSPDIPRLIRDKARTCANHPALLCYGLGNEIPSAMARWIGRNRLEAYLRELYYTVKEVDPGTLVSYVNYPTTEYLHLPFLDLVCFNVYLEQRDRLAAYLARLHNLAGDRPLVMSEIGLDAYRNGIDKQAEVLDWQLRTVFTEGCAGAVIFSWTDEWFRGGADVDDWEFGITDRQRRPKNSLATVSNAFAETPFPAYRKTPHVSVVLCTQNGSRTIAQSLEYLGRLEYPNYEVIVVDDGSTDSTAEIVAGFPVRLIRTENRGLSSARNTGWQAAEGEIVVYIDDDAFPDSQWLDYLVLTFSQGGYAAVGGPNLTPEADGYIAQSIARAPGGPTHVLLTDRTAEHIPGCNMAFRREVLAEIGGFDDQFRSAGDDVDICWRILESGRQIGFSPAAQVWHHRRPSIGAFWKQQEGYGKAEALLHRKWPQKFESVSHARWEGRVYVAGMNIPPGFAPVVYYGIWGEAPYQGLEGRPISNWQFLPLRPDWYVVNAVLATVSLFGIAWYPLLAALPLLAFSIIYPFLHVFAEVRHVRFNQTPMSPWQRRRLEVLIVFLNAVQPFARLWGRLRHGLTPWRQRVRIGFVWPKRRETANFETTWIDPHARLEDVESRLRATGALVSRGGASDRWDFELLAGIWATTRILMAAEDQGSGTQYVRFAVWPRVRNTGVILAAVLAGLAIMAELAGHSLVAVCLGGLAVALAWTIVHQAGTAMGTALSVVQPVRADLADQPTRSR